MKKMTKLFCIIFLFAIISGGVILAQEDADEGTEVELELRGKETVEVTGFIIDGRSLVSAEAFEAVSDASVSFDVDTGAIEVSYPEKPNIELELGNEQVYVNGEPVNMPLAPRLIQDELYMPLRIVFEHLEYHVGWGNGLITLEEIVEPVVEPLDVEDGTYRAASEASEDPYGFTISEVTFEDGYMVDVHLFEYDGVGLRKERDYHYDVETWQDIRDNYPEEYDSLQAMLDEMEERFVNYNTADVDTISGATGTANQAKDAVDRAIAMAKGETGPFDGTFMGVSEIGERSWGIALVTMEDGEMVEVQLEEANRHEPFGPITEAELKDEDYDWDEFHEARETMPEWFIEAQSPDVDTYTGATGSSKGWRQAVTRAMANAGVYERLVGSSAADDNGFAEADLVVEDGEFVDIGLTEYDNLGLRKDVDYEYNVENWAEIRDDYPEEYESLRAMLDEMVERIEAAEEIDEVDTISGATGTSEKAIDAVEKTLLEDSFNDTFMGISTISARGGWNLAWVEFEGDAIIDVSLEEVQEENGEYELKGEDYQWDEFHEAKDEMPAWFIEADSPEVDTYTNATSSAKQWMEAVEDAERRSSR